MSQIALPAKLYATMFLAHNGCLCTLTKPQMFPGIFPLLPGQFLMGDQQDHFRRAMLRYSYFLAAFLPALIVFAIGLSLMLAFGQF